MERTLTVPLEDLASMAVFAQVVQQRSFSAAARAVGIAKSAVSKRVAALEDRLGVRLLNRTTRTLALTEDGLRYYEHCAALLAAAAAAEEVVAGSSQAARGLIRINAPTTFSQMYLAPALAAFLETHPAIELNLSLEDRMVDVVEGGYDLVIRISRLVDSSLVARKLATDRMVVVGSPAYLARRGTPGAPHELVNHTCLRYTLLPGDREWRFGRRGARFGVPASGNFAASDGTVLREAARAGIGLAVLPYFMAAPDVVAGRLRLVLEDHLDARIDIHAVYASRRQLPLRTRLLLDHLVAWFGGDCWDALVAAAARTR